MSCIYLATNRINGMCYVGQAKNGLVKRRKRHEDTANKGSKTYFHNALRKYGFGTFKWEVLFYEKEKGQLDQWERHYIKRLKTKSPNGYNLTNGGDGLDSESAKEINNRPEIRAKKSKAMRRMWANPLIRAKMIAALHEADGWGIGRKHTEKSNAKNREAHLGRKHNKEAKAKNSIASKKMWADRSEEEKKRIITALTLSKIGVCRSEETKLKISKKLKGRPSPKPGGFGETMRKAWITRRAKQTSPEIAA